MVSGTDNSDGGVTEPLRVVPFEELSSSINYALQFKVHMPMVGNRKARFSDSESRIAADAIAKYLELCGFRPTKTPPLKGHGQNFPGSKSSNE